jgi:hypothetical protein
MPLQQQTTQAAKGRKNLHDQSLNPALLSHCDAPYPAFYLQWMFTKFQSQFTIRS